MRGVEIREAWTMKRRRSQERSGQRGSLEVYRLTNMSEERLAPLMEHRPQGQRNSPQKKREVPGSASGCLYAKVNSESELVLWSPREIREGAVVAILGCKVDYIWN